MLQVKYAEYKNPKRHYDIYFSRLTRVKDCFDQMHDLANKFEAIYKETDPMPIPTNDFNAEDKKSTYDPNPIFINTIIAKQRGTS